MAIQSYRDLEVWRRSMELAKTVYVLTKSFPREETYGLSSQMRRAAVSIPSNIAEGQGRLSTGEFLNQLSVSRGSLMELQTQIILAQELDYVESSKSKLALDATYLVAKLLNGLLRSLLRRSSENKNPANRGRSVNFKPNTNP